MAVKAYFTIVYWKKNINPISFKTKDINSKFICKHEPSNCLKNYQNT